MFSQPVPIDFFSALASSGTIQVGETLGWLSHPRVRRVRDDVTDQLRRKEYQFRGIGPVIFLCGAKDSRPRDRLYQYLRVSYPASHLFYAEHVWDIIAQADPISNALEVERRLARLSDMVIVVVESAGTFAELGAFAISDELREKLLPLLELRFKDEPSFIATGPVNWINQTSNYAPSIWLRQDRILESVGEIEQRLSRVPSDKDRRVADLLTSPKHLLFFLCDLVGIFGPCSPDDVRRRAEAVLNQSVSDVELYLGLGKAVGVLASVIHEVEVLYYRPLVDGRLPSFHRTKKFIDIATLRARMVGAMQLSAEGSRALEAISGGNDVAS